MRIGANFPNISFEIDDPDFPIHYRPTTFMALTFNLVHVQCNVKDVFGRKFLSTVEIGPENGGLGEWGVNVKFWFCHP